MQNIKVNKLAPPMKNILIIILFLFSVKAVACSCGSRGIIEKYLESDFVASAVITKDYLNAGEEEIYRSDIQIEELFKGEELKSIYVRGRSDGKLGSTCSIFIPERTKLIIYAYKNKDGHYEIGVCSGLLYLNKNEDSKQLAKQLKELQILRVFKTNNIADQNYISSWNRELRTKGLSEALEQLKGIELDKHFGFYEMSLNADLTVNTVKVISGFNKTIDSKVMEILRNLAWEKIDEAQENHPENRKLLIGIYYYEAERGNRSFLSHHYL